MIQTYNELFYSMAKKYDNFKKKMPAMIVKIKTVRKRRLKRIEDCWKKLKLKKSLM